MHPDIAQFRAFYDARLGTIARRLVRRRLREFWPDVRGLTIAGLGYATPYLGPFVDQAQCVVACMPAEQGAVAWPRSGQNRVALADDTNLPFDDGSIDRVLLVHGMETSELLRDLLRQVWRILKPDGKLVVVAPNRRGMWSTFGDTPFGLGYPYSRGQLERRLAEGLFKAERWQGVLFGPPVASRLIMRTGRAWESTGRLIYPGMPGLWIVEATKAMYAPASGARPNAVRQRVLKPATARVSAERSGAGSS
jgi:SAM-dependent methyltransferase